MPSEQQREKPGPFSQVAALVFIELRADTEHARGLPPQSFGFDEFTNDPCDKPSMEYPLPPQDQRRAEAQEDMRVARGATST